MAFIRSGLQGHVLDIKRGHSRFKSDFIHLSSEDTTINPRFVSKITGSLVPGCPGSLAKWHDRAWSGIDLTVGSPVVFLSLSADAISLTGGLVEKARAEGLCAHHLVCHGNGALSGSRPIKDSLMLNRWITVPSGLRAGDVKAVVVVDECLAESTCLSLSGELMKVFQGAGSITFCTQLYMGEKIRGYSDIDFELLAPTKEGKPPAFARRWLCSGQGTAPEKYRIPDCSIDVSADDRSLISHYVPAIGASALRSQRGVKVVTMGATAYHGFLFAQGLLAQGVSATCQSITPGYCTLSEEIWMSKGVTRFGLQIYNHVLSCPEDVILIGDHREGDLVVSVAKTIRAKEVVLVHPENRLFF